MYLYSVPVWECAVYSPLIIPLIVLYNSKDDVNRQYRTFCSQNYNSYYY